MKKLDLLATILIVVGGLNWGLWGILEFDLVAAIFGGNTTMLAKAVYALVGIAAVLKVGILLASNLGAAGSPRMART